MKISRVTIFAVLVVSVILFVLFQSFSTARNTIVYVDSEKLLNGYKGMMDARAEFEKKRSVWQTNIDSLTKEVKDAIAKYSKNLSFSTEKEKELSRELIQTKQKELNDYQSAIKENAGQEEARLNHQVFSTVNAYLERFGKKHKFKMVLIASNGNIAYADPAIDITDVIVEELNKEYATPAK
ncbi:MAG TPA: OmpH family outer membrane protein [Puia sp.]|jgi:outer membrane protein|nr:OmpH family outer membrane protein [Puia sp.]